jgi:hypothetical protein
MDTTSILSIVSVGVSLLSGFYVAFKHSSCKSKCLGSENEFQLDLSPLIETKNISSIQNGRTGESKYERSEEA